ncbi:MAG: hypothetical protein J6U05_00880 [Neisseriaceae bacterium]|nr:hypothetical protein [Neisseriaceae bacterium]MBO7380215.1 hypothetical protein [Neisseriaceae bacterium]
MGILAHQNGQNGFRQPERFVDYCLVSCVVPPYEVFCFFVMENFLGAVLD